MTVDGYEATFATNHLGPFLLTNLLLDRLQESAPSRIVNVASTAHTAARKGIPFDDLQSNRRYRGMRVYGESKLANILFTLELSRRLAGSGVTANALHPGTVRTGYGADGDARGLLALGLKISRPFFLSPEKGAAHVDLSCVVPRSRGDHRAVLRQMQADQAPPLGPGCRSRPAPLASERRAGRPGRTGAGLSGASPRHGCGPGHRPRHGGGAGAAGARGGGHGPRRGPVGRRTGQVGPAARRPRHRVGARRSGTGG